MTTRTLIVGTGIAVLALVGGGLCIGELSAGRPEAMAPVVLLPPAAPELDPAYAAGSIKIASEMGITAAELRRRYRDAAEICRQSPEAIWGEHVRMSKTFGAEGALEMIPKGCQMRRDNP